MARGTFASGSPSSTTMGYGTRWTYDDAISNAAWAPCASRQRTPVAAYPFPRYKGVND